MLELVPQEDLESLLDRPFYSTGDVARIAHVSPSTVLNYIRDGRIAAVRISERTIRIPRRSVLKLLSVQPLPSPRRVTLADIPLEPE